MAVELATAYVSLIVSAKGARKAVDKELGAVEKDAAGTGQGIGSKLASGLGKSLKAGAIGAGIAVGGVLGTAVVKGFGRLQALENAEAKLSGLGHSAENVTGIMKDALAAVKGTAFGMDEAAATAAGAVAAGIKPGKDLEAVLRLTGDAATIAGTGMGEMGAIFNKVATSNKIQGDVIAQLSDKGIPIVQLMAKELGVTAESVVDMASKGEIGFDVFRSAMENGMGGAALKSGETVGGAFKNMNAALGRFGAAMLKDTYPIFAPVFGALTGWIDTATEKVGPLATALNQNLFGSLESIWGILARRDFTGPIFGMQEDHPFIGYLFDFRDAVTATFDRVRAAFTDGRILDVGARVREVFERFKPIFADLAPVLMTALTAFSPLAILFQALMPVLPRLADAVADIAVVLAGVLTSALGFLVPLVVSIVSGFADFLNGVTATKGGVDGLMGVVAVATGIFVAYKVGVLATTGVLKAQAIVTTTVATAQKVLNTVMRANPIGLIITLIAGLVAGLVWFFTQTKTGQAIVQNVWAAIQSFVGGVVVWFQTYVLPVVQTVFGAVGAIFTWLWKNIIQPVFKGIGWAINAWWQVTSALFGLAIGFIRDKLGAVFTWLWENIISPVFTWIGDAISWWWNNITLPVFNALVAFFRNTLGPVFTWLYENVIKPVWDGIGSAIKWVWDTILKPVFDKIGEVVRGIPAAFEAARDGIASAWNAIMEIAKKPVIFVVDTVIGGLIDTFNKIPGVNITKPKLPSSFYGNAGTSGPTQNGRVRAFAKGGFAAPGWALVGEEGPELVNFSKPGRVYTAKDTAHALGAPMPGSESHIWGPPQQAAKRAGAMRFHGLGAFPMNMLNRAAAAWNGLAGVSAQSVKHMVGGFGANSIGVRHGAMLNPNWIGYYQGQGVAIKPGGPNELATLVHEIGHALGLGHNTGNQSVMHPMLGAGGAFWPTSYDAQNLRRIYGGVGSGVTRDPGDGGTGVPDNPFSGLVDQLMGAFKKQFPGGGLFIDAAGGLAKSGIESVVKIVNDIKDGIKRIAGDVFGKITDFFGGGSGQVAELHDNGGYLQPGYSTILNKTRKPEAILNQRQWSDISKLALEGGGGRSITIQGNVGWDPAEVARRIELSERRARVVEGVLV